MKLTQKKTPLIIITVAAVGIFIWQVYSLLNSDISLDTNSGISMAAPVETPAESNAELQRHSHPDRSRAQHLIPEALEQQNNHVQMQTTPYLKLVNHYKIVKMQHKLLQEELSIAKVRSQIAHLNQRPLQSSGDGNDDESVFGIKSNNAIKNETTLVYLDYQNAQWSAILKDSDGYHQVGPDSILSKNRKIIRINRSGVIMQAGAKRFNLSFNGITPLPTPHPLHFTHRKTSPPKPEVHSILPLKTFAAEQKVIHNKITAHKPPTKAIPIPKKAVKEKTPVKHTLDETVILEMPAKSYTIRLKRSNNMKDLINYANQNHMGDRTLLYTNKKSSNPSFTLVFGDYLTTRAAQAALANLARQTTDRYSIALIEDIQKEIEG